MKTWKLLAIIAATAVSTAAAVAYVIQKSREKNKMHFDSDYYDDDDFMNDICNYNPDEEENEEEPAEEIAEPEVEIIEETEESEEETVLPEESSDEK